jgi:hypothetical protein
MAGHKMWEKCPIQLPYSLDEVPPKFFLFLFLFFWGGGGGGQQNNFIGRSRPKKKKLGGSPLELPWQL